MDMLKIYVGHGTTEDFLSILVTDENVTEKNLVMKTLRFRQVIVFTLIMKKIVEEGFINRGYKIADFVIRDDEDVRGTLELIKEINENPIMFYKLWSKDYDYVDKVILEKDGERLEFLSNGRYTNSENAREIIHLAISRIFTLNKKL